MATANPIISVGRDLPLLHTRAAVLRGGGYSVVTVSPDTPSLDILLRRQPPLVLVCHTVRGARLDSVLEKAERAGAPVLKLARGGVIPTQLIATVTATVASATKAPRTGPWLFVQAQRASR
jgi:hypothetical protein